ncbi:Regulator of nonsense transcripts 2 [Ceratocystis platani]|uniref:Regulator of nonsense transcripts 2 n=1 Tax=Ceratocystis fimbriata f. sp. platani TaxID=88771 RepID=A0A0F8DHQ7_CERFI|nr:Regulator of nonsense transcripts 2 [Ceratocystis platani]
MDREKRHVFPISASLDSSLKKNTAFIKRLRTTISAATLPTFLQEIRTLSLHKYLAEIVSACYEGLCKLKNPGDVEAGVEITSALHQRFGPTEFTMYLGWLLGKGMASPDKSLMKTLSPEQREKSEKERIPRQRILLRVVTELWLVDVLRTLDDVARPDDVALAPKAAATTKTSEAKAKAVRQGVSADPFPYEVLKDLLNHDREHANLPLLVIFVKSFNWDILGVKPLTAEGRRTTDDETTATTNTDGNPQEDGRDLSGKDASAESSHTKDVSDSESHPPFASAELQNKFKHILSMYFEDVKRHVIRGQEAITEQARKNSETYVKAGEVFEDRQASFDKQLKVQERLVASAQVLADAVGAEMPDLKNCSDSGVNANGSIGLVKAGEYLRSLGEGAGIWNDEDERRFYENLVDLKGKVPPILLEDAKKKKQNNDEQVGKPAEVEAAVAVAPDTSSAGASAAASAIAPTSTLTPTPTATPIDDQSMIIANKTIGAQVDALVGRLPSMNTKDLVDETAIDFCFLNSKASRNRLVKALTDVPKGRSDLLPYWARLVATLGQYMADVPKGLVDYLDAEFRSLQRRKEKEFLGQVRLANIRYLAELTKFGIVPEHVVFHCLKVSLDDFSRMNIDIMCNLLENCGRYLFLNPETSPRMTSFLETLQRKKSVLHIGPDERMKIENAVNLVNPPERPAIQQKERTPVELYIRKLIYSDMTRRNYSKILRQIRKLHWEEPEVVHILVKVFSKPHKIKFGSIHLLAIVLSALYRHHPHFVVDVISRLLESITQGLEQNEYRLYQKRVAEMRYLGELYNYRMLEHSIVFDTLWKVILFGYPGPPIPGTNPLDPPDDVFRIRLVATLLESCGTYFNKGSAGKKLDHFLTMFQYYIFTKGQLPMDTEFVVQDVFSLLRPQWQMANDIQEAAVIFQSSLLEQQKAAGIDTSQDPDEHNQSDDASDDSGESDDGDDDDEDDSSDEEDDDDDDSSDMGMSSEDETFVVNQPEPEEDPEEDDEFDREYAKLMAESLESRKHDRKLVFDVPLPIRPRGEAGIASGTGSNDYRSSTTSDNGSSTFANGDANHIKSSTAPGSKMAFSLLTKKGNRQQTRTFELPSDSSFAAALRTQQQAEREEQQRIKNLVLSYEMQESDESDGQETARDRDRPATFQRLDRKDRNKPHSRKLQWSDVEWT